MDQVKTFTIRFDERTKQILVSLLDNGIVQTSQAITAGDYSEELLQQHEELVQVKNGILYTRPDEITPDISTIPEVTTEEATNA